MTGKTQDTEFRHPEAAAFLQSLTDEETAKHFPIVRESGGVAVRYWREGDEVRCREAPIQNLANRLPIHARPPRDRADRQAVSSQLLQHDNSLQFDHPI